MSDDTSASVSEQIDEYSVGPLDDSTWLTIYAMLTEARSSVSDVEPLYDEYQEATEAFLSAHPDGVFGAPEEDWSDGMKEAWNDMVSEMIRHV